MISSATYQNSGTAVNVTVIIVNGRKTIFDFKGRTRSESPINPTYDSTSPTVLKKKISYKPTWPSSNHDGKKNDDDDDNNNKGKDEEVLYTSGRYGIQ